MRNTEAALHPPRVLSHGVREKVALEREMKHRHAEMRKLVTNATAGNDSLGDLNERIHHAEQRITEIREQVLVHSVPIRPSGQDRALLR